MKMILKIVIFWMLFFGTIVLDQQVLRPQNIILPDIVLYGWLFCVYLALLYFEVRTRIKKATTQKQMRWAGFHFTFWAGFIWGMFFAGFDINSWFFNPITFFGFVSSFIIWGIIFGILGMAITQFMVIYVFKQPEQI
jgi:hypothetical protein